MSVVHDQETKNPKMIMKNVDLTTEDLVKDRLREDPMMRMKIVDQVTGGGLDQGMMKKIDMKKRDLEEAREIKKIGQRGHPEMNTDLGMNTGHGMKQSLGTRSNQGMKSDPEMK